ncbi:MAG: glycerol-3-phosphate acyltransferase [Actinomycetota bacterium]
MRRRDRDRGWRRLIGPAVVGYLAGTIPSADVATRLATGGDTDLRDEGSGNPGATNAGAVLGYGWGLGVMAADIGKAAAACGVGRRLAGADGANVAGTAAVIGHCYPVHNGFKGGKGVAASVGQCAATFPAYFPIDVGVALATAVVPWWRQRAFAATAVASAAWVAGGVLWWRKGWPNAYGPEPRASLPLASAVSSAVIMAKFVQGSRSRATGSGNGA